jgi:23S rRNA pseudoU1915 N3-methylase RlmH
MFRCELSKQLSEPFEKPILVVVEKRFKEYYGFPFRKFKDKRFSSSQQHEPQKLSEGWEIVKTIKVRKSVLERLKQEGKEIEAKWVK